MAKTDKKIVILGGGESGVGAALLAQSKGFSVFLSDKSEITEKYTNILDEHKIAYEQSQHSEAIILEASEIIKSPGIPSDIPILIKAKEKKIPIISEIEFAARYTSAKIIAITGSNGKTTTTLLTYHLLQSCGYSVGLAGNIGESFAQKVMIQTPDYWVLEISSFQLEDCYKFSPDVAILLNITPDHLDRYENNFQLYVEAKFRITQNLSSKQHFIYLKDNAAISREIRKRSISATQYAISLSENQENGAYLKDDTLIFNLKKTKQTLKIDTHEIPLKGKHNLTNSMAAVLACLQVGANLEELVTYFKSFEGVPHRLEEVAVINDVKFINDSKATNVDSVYFALDSFDEPIVWIAGGVDKGNDYDKIKELVHRKVKYLICLGKDNRKLFNTFKDDLKIVYQTDNIRDAVEQAFSLAKAGDVILFSPACASFDLFANYEDRGEQFKKTITKINRVGRLR
jgi:UDP-N-acetylmuramoylalanine--D-glutamate ligase